MMKKFLIPAASLIVIVASSLYLPSALNLMSRNENELSPQAVFIRDFYQKYMNASNRHTISPSFSKAFREDDRRDSENCKKTEFLNEICGWSASGDVYLDSQEYDGLDFSNSKFHIGEDAGGRIIVSFNVMPQFKDGKDPYYDKELEFLVIQEAGDWVVDDFGPKGNLYRKRMYRQLQETATP